MLDLIFVALFQAAAGPVDPAPPTAPPEQTQAAPADTATAPGTPAPADVAPPSEAAGPPATTLEGPTVPGEQTTAHAEQANERTCRPATNTGSRVSRRMVCSSDSDRRNQQDLATDLTSSSVAPVSR